MIICFLVGDLKAVGAPDTLLGVKGKHAAGGEPLRCLVSQRAGLAFGEPERLLESRADTSRQAEDAPCCSDGRMGLLGSSIWLQLSHF